jgi:hypothetical protein
MMRVGGTAERDIFTQAPRKNARRIAILAVHNISGGTGMQPLRIATAVQQEKFRLAIYKKQCTRRRGMP